MIVVLCHPDDAPAVWLGRALVEEGAQARCVTIEEIVYAPRIIHRFGGEADGSIVTSATGSKIDVGKLSGIVNRVRFVPSEHLRLVAEADRGYAMEELWAFLLAWLDAAPCPVLNAARPACLGGDRLHPLRLRSIAAMAGLPVNRRGLSSDQPDVHWLPEATVAFSLIIFGDRIFGPLVSKDTQDAARRFARLSGFDLVQIDFALGPSDRPSFVDASGHPDFRLGGRALSRALAASLGAPA